MSLVAAVRYGVPGAMLLVGLVLVIGFGGNAEGAGVVLVGSAVLVALAAGLLRFSVGEGAERDSEQAARDHYLAHGHWPGEAAAPEPEPEPEPEAKRPAAEPHQGVRAVPLEPGRARRARRARPPRRRR